LLNIDTFDQKGRIPPKPLTIGLVTGRLLVGMIRAELTCCGITRGASCDIGTAITGGATAAAGVNANHSINASAISPNTPKGTAIPTAMATACELWELGRHCPVMLSKK
jgi:hypothetical protein